MDHAEYTAENDWLTRYHKYGSYVESPKIFHTWVGLSLLSAALQRKVMFKEKATEANSNLFVVLIGPPGASRKSSAIKLGLDLIRTLREEILVSPDSITREALLIRLEKSTRSINGNPNHNHCSMTVLASELETFLRGKHKNQELLQLLIHGYDAVETHEYDTKTAGNNFIQNLWINLLAATTPTSILNCFDPVDFGGGLPSRMIFAYAKERERKVPIIEWNLVRKKLRDELIRDVEKLTKLSGTFSFGPRARDWYDNYYLHEHIEKGPKRVCQSELLDAWYSRFMEMVLKVALIFAATRTAHSTSESKRHVTIPDLERAIEILQATEPGMGEVFGTLGKSEISQELSMFLKIVKESHTITEAQLFDKVLQTMDAKMLDRVIVTAVRAGKIARRYPEGQPPFFEWIGE